MKRSFLAYPYCVYALVFFVAPLMLIVYYSLISPEGAFTLDHFIRFFDSGSPYLKVMIKSLRIALISTAVCLGIGYPMAYILSRMKPRVRSLLSLLFVLPMWMNFLLRTYAWMALLENNGLINTLLRALNLPEMRIMYTETAVIFGMVYNFLPFMILPIYNTLIKVDKNLIEASQDLGANPRRVFTRVILPTSIPGVMSGIMMVFMPAVTTFVISRLLGGSNDVLIGDLIEQQFKLVNDWGFGSAMSVIIMVLILASMAFMQRSDRNVAEGGGLI